MTCKAIQYSDQMVCKPCQLAWDVNDPEPPRCLTVGDRVARGGEVWVVLGFVLRSGLVRVQVREDV